METPIPTSGAVDSERRHSSIKRKRIALNTVLAALVIGGGVAGWFAMRPGTNTTSATQSVVTATRSTVDATVSGSGNVTATASYDVSFPSAAGSSLVTAVDVKVGDKVTKGQVLATVDDSTLRSALLTAQAQLAQAQTTLDDLRNSPTAADLAQYAAQDQQAALAVTAAKEALATARANLTTDTTQQAAAVTAAEQSLADTQAKIALDAASLQTQIDRAQATLTADQQAVYDAQIATLDATDENRDKLYAAVEAAEATMNQSRQAVDDLIHQQQSAQLSAAESLRAAETAVTSARTTRDTRLASDQQAIASADRQVTSSQLSYTSTLAANAQKREGATDAELKSAEAAVANDENAVASAQTNLDGATLVAPVDGTVSVVNGKVGASASSTTSSASSTGTQSSSTSAFITVVNLAQLEVKVGFAESDAVSLAKGQAVTVTFDSLSGVKLNGTIRAIDVTSTTVSNVVTYYTYITLLDVPSDQSVKPGMSASVVVTVKQAKDVISLPVAAVPSSGTSATVNVEVGNDPTQTRATQITLGLRGDSAVEVTSGLAEGDKVVVTRGATSSGGSSTGAASSTTVIGSQGGPPDAGGFGGAPAGGGGALP